MSSEASARGIRVVTAARVVLWALLWFFAWLPVRGFLSLPITTAFLLFSLALGVWGPRFRIRYPWLLALCALVPLLFRCGVEIAAAVWFRQARGIPAESFPLLLDRHLLVLSVPMAATMTSVSWGTRKRGWVVPEALLQGLFLLPLFWDQGEFRMTRFSHPLFFALSIAALIAIHISVLGLSARAGARRGAALTIGAGLTTPRLTGGAGLTTPRLTAYGGRFPFLPLSTCALLILLLCLIYRGWSGSSAPAGGGLMEPTLFSFDFSRYVSLETEISVKDDLLLLMKREGPPQVSLVRRFVLSGYRPDKGFFMAAGPGEPEPLSAVPAGETRLPVSTRTGRREVTQEYFLVNIAPSSLLGINEPERIVPYMPPRGSSFSAMYRVDSLAPIASSDINPWELSDAGTAGMDRELLRFYTRYGDDARIAALAAEITAGVTGYYERVKAVESYLRQEYWYSQKPGIAADGDQLGHFLFVSRKGYCSYFAFAMTLLLRSLGIPARVVVGFWADPESALLSVYPIRADMAHAWVEVHFGSNGWIEFDPTSHRIAPGEEYEVSRVDPERFESLIREIVEYGDLLVPLVPKEGAVNTGLSPAIRVIRAMAAAFGRSWYLSAPALYLICVLFLRLLPLFPVSEVQGWRVQRRDRTRWRTQAHGRAQEPSTETPSPEQRREARLRLMARRRFLFLYRVLCASGAGKKKAESILEYCGRIDDRYGLGLRATGERYLGSVFSATFSADDYAAFSDSLRAALRLTGKRIGPRAVAACLLTPRALFRRLP